MTEAQATTTDSEEITRSEAAALLGVSVTTVKGYPIPFRQYKPKSKAVYLKADVLAFKHSKIYPGDIAA
ncbi:MAG: hypothetical protein L3K52_05500 [Candidatus Thiothrix sulfatifontis]|nr:MAG: hypothetical protein L3K52_05500 [Candidatus Thiothrix sulfatifontis]